MLTIFGKRLAVGYTSFATYTVIHYTPSTTAELIVMEISTKSEG